MVGSSSRGKSPVPGASSRPTIFIARNRGWGLAGVREIWEYRELLYSLARRDVKLRYKQAALGSAWAIIQPLLYMLVFTIFFGHLAHVPSDGVPYQVFYYAGLVPWVLFSSSLAGAANSVAGNSVLISRVYFPRLVMPLASLGAFLFDFVIALALLPILMVVYDTYPGIDVLWLPALTVLALLAASSVGIWLAALNVKYRDVRYVVPFLVTIWLFASPVAYPASIVPHAWRFLYGLNPMVGVIEGFRWALLGTNTNPGPYVLLSVVVTTVILVGGLAYFQRAERAFADVI
jgi:lipopolysaccharide transport system permease protein